MWVWDKCHTNWNKNGETRNKLWKSTNIIRALYNKSKPLANGFTSYECKKRVKSKNLLDKCRALWALELYEPKYSTGPASQRTSIHTPYWPPVNGSTRRHHSRCDKPHSEPDCSRVVILPVQKVFLPGQRQKVVKTWQKGYYRQKVAKTNSGLNWQ